MESFIKIGGEGMLTVFTPAYNKANTLKRLYESLKKQKNFDSSFEWIVINDGSTDQTDELMQELIKENEIAIHYIQKQNGGKQRAYNEAVQIAKGDYFICMDGDDYFTEDAFQKIEQERKAIQDQDEIAGIGFLEYQHGSKEIVGSKFPEDRMIATYSDIYYRHHVTGDKQLTFKTKVLKEFPFPVQEGENFISEGIVFNRIAKKYQMVFLNEPIAYVEYLADGYSANYFSLVKKNPKGNMLYLKELYEVDPKLYHIAAFDLFGIYAKKKWKEVVKEHPNRFLATILYPVAYLKYRQKERKKGVKP